MKGVALIYRSDKVEPEVTRLDTPSDLAFLKQAIGGGYIEAVPGFDTISHAGKRHACVAFCDEEGKLKGYPLNNHATTLWQAALMPEASLIGRDGAVLD